MEHSNSNQNIFFFRPYGTNGYLSNFYSINFNINNIKFTSSEQAFMYYKCLTFDGDNKKLLSKILREFDPNKIKKLGRSVRYFKQDKWNEVKYNIMLKCIRNKFLQNRVIREKLINTYPRQLYEASPWDNIWGIGYDIDTAQVRDPETYGQNLLGKALMEIRDEFL